MQTMAIFSDASFDPTAKVGIAGFLILNENEIENFPSDNLEVKTQTIQNTTCTRLELESILWALEGFLEQGKAASKEKILIKLYTDCQLACDLSSRRKKLEANGFIGRRSGRSLRNGDLYRKFFTLCDLLSPELIWTKGHMSSKGRSREQQIFSIVDRVTRQKLREMLVSPLS